MDPTDHPQSPDKLAAEARIVRLEEHLGYAERSIELLSEEVRALNMRLREVTQRLNAAEARLGKTIERLESASGEPDGCGS